tara:strand:+ start:8298 stop:8429 length:132 start_codon:yes stop_codon:yes gene_type:complete
MHGHHLAKFILALVLGALLGLGVFYAQKSATPEQPVAAQEDVI